MIDIQKKEDWLLVYEELGREIIPLSSIDGLGKIEQIEAGMFKLGEDKVFEFAAWETKHHFSDGVYTRETFIPAGTLLTGIRHKQKTISILAQGAITVMGVDRQGRATDYGVLVAPFIMVTEPNIKKIGYAHEDTVFINSFSLAGIPKEYHNEEGLEMIEDYIFDKRTQLCLVCG